MSRTNIARAEADFEAEYDALVQKYGNDTNIPKEENHLVREKLRASYCLAASPNTSPIETFKHYSVDERVWGFFVTNLPEKSADKKVKRTDKYQAIMDWTKEHLFEEVTPQTIMEIGEISYPTALKFITERPDIFRKVKRGTYEVRDPKADREADKQV